MGSRDMTPLRDGTKQRNPTYLRENIFREMLKFDALAEPNRDIQRRAFNIPDSRTAPTRHLFATSCFCSPYPFVPPTKTSKFTLAHDAVAVALSHTHHLIIHVGTSSLSMARSRCWPRRLLITVTKFYFRHTLGAFFSPFFSRGHTTHLKSLWAWSRYHLLAML